jgi:Tat protein secretion system quality control protein TatD with DNase activity
MINSAIQLDEWKRGLQIANNHDCVYLSVGLDPILHKHHNDLKKWIDEHVSGIIAIGEIGLDYCREQDHTQRELQQNALQLICLLMNFLSEEYLLSI